MKAVVLSEPGRLDATERRAPAAPGADEAIIAPRRVGLCGTDYHAYAGRQNFFTYPRVLGHEIAAEVVAIGSQVTNVAVGDHCAVLPYLACHACSACLRGRTNCCERLGVLGVTMDGALCEQFTVPASSLFPAPALGDDALALVETLGIGFHAVARADVQPDELALVVGAGPVGLAVAEAARVRGARVALVDSSADRAAAAGQILGLPALVRTPNLEDELRDLGDGELPTAVFDATGNADSMAASAHLVNATGSLVLVGHTAGRIHFDNPLLHRRELTILASRNALATEWPHLIELVSAGHLDALPWINRRTSLDDTPEDFVAWSQPGSGVLKGVVEIGSDSHPPPSVDRDESR